MYNVRSDRNVHQCAAGVATGTATTTTADAANYTVTASITVIITRLQFFRHRCLVPNQFRDFVRPSKAMATQVFRFSAAVREIFRFSDPHVECAGANRRSIKTEIIKIRQGRTATGSRNSKCESRSGFLSHGGNPAKQIHRLFTSVLERPVGTTYLSIPSVLDTYYVHLRS